VDGRKKWKRTAQSRNSLDHYSQTGEDTDEGTRKGGLTGVYVFLPYRDHTAKIRDGPGRVVSTAMKKQKKSRVKLP